MAAKALKIDHCIVCLFNRFKTGQKIDRFKCINDDAKRKNGSYRIIDKDIVMEGKIPGWCPLDDWPWPV